ncbi:hypothetical protein K438DRAFT_2023406 [Mycena galopus ATCC 62051]|nr:hypothetical protein K438DRAFT_2023406 [Mycena galopus ATCC 62051]
MGSPLDSTYGVWLVSLFLETILYGMGVLQTWIYFAGRPTDLKSVKWTVLVVLVLETIQVVFFFRSSYSRFVERFGQIQLDLIWADSLQLLAAYLSGFIVQMYITSSTRYPHACSSVPDILRVAFTNVRLDSRASALTLNKFIPVTKNRKRFGFSAVGIYIILLLAVVQLVAGIVQTVWSYELRSFLKIGETKAITTLQAAASLLCDLLITTFLCAFLKSQKGDIGNTNYMMDMLIHDAINRGVLTSLSSGVNMVLFLALPDTFWFFLGLAPNSKFYMNSMLATLNTRGHMREKVAANDKGWNSIQMGTLATSNGPKKIQGQTSFAAVDFETASVDKREDFPACV